MDGNGYIKLYSKFEQKIRERRGNYPKEEYRQYRKTISTAIAILQQIDRFTFEDIQVEFMKLKVDYGLKWLMRRYEFLLEGFFVDREKAVMQFYEELKVIARKLNVTENRRKFLNYVSYVLVQIKESLQYGFYVLYADLLLQQLSLLVADQNYLIAGLSSDNREWICVMDIYPSFDELACYLDFHPSADKKEIQMEIRRLNLPDDVIERSGYYVSLCRTYANMYYYCAPFLTEKTKQFLPNGSFSPIIFQLPRVWRDTEFYISQLDHKVRALPLTGIEVEFRNAGEICSLLIGELIKDDSLYMMYQVNTTAGKFMGYYDQTNHKFFSIYSLDTSIGEFNCNFANFILEVYAILTTKMSLDGYRRLTVMRISNELAKEPLWGRQPAMFPHWPVVSQNKPTKESNKLVTTQSEYAVVEVGHYIRRLPMGQKVSEEAKERATKWGYELEQGYTFVSDFKRKVYGMHLFE